MLPNKHNSTDSLFTKRYLLQNPSNVYPYSELPITTKQTIDNTKPLENVSNYPDFFPWKHTFEEDNIAINNVQKGYQERSIVGFDLMSGRSFIHGLLNSNNKDKNPLTNLSNNMLITLKKRKNYNKINTNSNFKPPPRVTLTEQKKETWLKNLSDNSISLRKLSRTIPHGIRNKTLLDQLINKKIPINRAIWLIKCIALNELRQLKRKTGNSDIQENDLNESAWINEWTKQLTNYLEIIFSLNNINYFTLNFDNSSSIKFKILYLNELINQLFFENLINKKLFLTILINKILPNCGFPKNEEDEKIDSKFHVTEKSFDQIYIILCVFIKNHLQFILKKFVFENYYENGNFYTNLLKTLIEHLILKYDYIYKNFNLKSFIELKNVESNINTPMSGYKIKTPNSLINQFSIPNSPFSETENEHEKINKIIFNLKNSILINIKIILINLFLLNNGELFILPKKNWSLLKRLLVKYNILNNKKNNSLQNELDSNKEDDTDIISDPNVILQHGINFDIDNNFIIKNNHKIILKRQFDIICNRNDVLSNNLSNVFKELLIDNDDIPPIIDENHEIKNVYYKIWFTVNEILSYKFFYLIDLKNTSINKSEKNYIFEKIDELIELIFDDFKNLITFCKGSIDQLENVEIIKKKFQVLLKFSIFELSVETTNKKSLLIIYILKQITLKFKSNLSNNSSETNENKNSPSDFFKDQDDSIITDLNIKQLGKRQIINNFKNFLQNEILEVIFNIHNNNIDNEVEFHRLLNDFFENKNSIVDLLNIDEKCINDFSKFQVKSDLINRFENLKLNLNNININNLLNLINYLLDEKIISLTIYIRKLINSGILYLQERPNFLELNLFQYLILKNLGIKILNDELSNNNQLNLILKNLKKNISIESFQFNKKLLVENYDNINDLKSYLQGVLDTVFEGDEIVYKDIQFNAEIPIKNYLANWFFEKLSQKLSTDNIFIKETEINLIFKIFSNLNKLEFFFNIVKLILILTINKNLKIDYKELFFLIKLVWEYKEIINFLPDYKICEIEFENKNSIIMKNVKYGKMNKENYLKTFDLLKLAVNNYFKLNDSNEFVNCHEFGQFWKFFLSDIETFNSENDDVLGNFKNQLIYLIESDGLVDNELVGKLVWSNLQIDFDLENFETILKKLVMKLFDQVSDDLITLLSILKKNYRKSFDTSVFKVCDKITGDYNSKRDFYLFLVSNDLLEIDQLIDNNDDWRKSNNETILLIFDVLFHNNDDEMLKMKRNWYFKNQFENFINLILLFLNEDVFEIIKSKPIDPVLREFFLTNTEHYQLINKKINSQNNIKLLKIFEILKEILYNSIPTLEIKKIHGIGDIYNIVYCINENNLSICQLIISVLINNELKNNKETVKFIYFKFLVFFFLNLNVKKNFKISLIKNLFDYLNNKLKLILLEEIEKIYLNSNFPKIELLNINNKFNDFLPFIGLTIDLKSNISLNEEIITGIDKKLDEITLFLSNEQPNKAILIFLKILMINKISIIKLFFKNHAIINENFIKKLLNLLKLIKNKKLKNYFVDFLILIKLNLLELAKNLKLGNKFDFNLPKFNNDNLNFELTKRILHDDETTFFIKNKKTTKYNELIIKPFDKLEDSNPVISVNDSSINLKYFETVIDRKNPS